MMLASIETYLLDVIARQRDMSKIATQSANDRLKLNFINRIYKFLYEELYDCIKESLLSMQHTRHCVK